MLDECELSSLYVIENLALDKRIAIAAWWTRDYINALPDSCFLWIEPDNKKDAAGRTIPRTARHIVYKDRDGKVSIPQLRAARWKITRSQMPSEIKAKLRPKLSRLWKENGIKEGSPMSASQMEDAIHWAMVIRLEADLEESERWDVKYINDLPDSAFLIVEPGEKDDDGKTVPRSKRHLPVHNKDGSIDIPHLKNARARLNQVGVSPELKGKAATKLDQLAKKHLKSYEPLGKREAAEVWLTDDVQSDEDFSLEMELSFSETAEGGLFDDPRFEPYREAHDLLFVTCRFATGNAANKNGKTILGSELQSAHPTMVNRPINWRHLRTAPIGVIIATQYAEGWAYAAGVIWLDINPRLVDLKTEHAEGRLSVSWELMHSKAEDREHDTVLTAIRFVGMAICPTATAAVKGAAVLEMAANTQKEDELMADLAIELKNATEARLIAEAKVKELEGKLTEATEKVAKLESAVSTKDEEKEEAVKTAVQAESERQSKIEERTEALKAIYVEVAMPEDLADVLDDGKFEVLKAEAAMAKLTAENKALAEKLEAAEGQKTPSGATKGGEGDGDKDKVKSADDRMI